MFWFIVLTLVVSTYGKPKGIYQGRIVGGETTNIEKYPYQVSIEYAGFLLCGGSIISPIYVITAAHCTLDQSPLALFITAGSNTTHGGQQIQVEEIYENPLDDTETRDYDISILLLSTPIVFGPAAMPIKLAPQHFVFEPKEKVTITGWGALEEDGHLATYLQVVEITTVSNEECGEAYKHYAVISDKVFCAEEIGKDSCQGDSGGPVVARGVLVGVVSWGIGCARPSFPSVYTRISEFRDFIKNVTQI